jgi:hypothetical protein
MKLTLQLVSQVRLAVVRLAPTQSIPSWILSADANDATSEALTTTTSVPSFLSITRTNDELSVVCPESIVPKALFSNDNIKIEDGWVYLKVCGPLDFSLTGILAGLAKALASEGISIFAISTYDTDYILVKQDAGEAAATVLEKLGHTILRV